VGIPNRAAFWAPGPKWAAPGSVLSGLLRGSSSRTSLEKSSSSVFFASSSPLKSSLGTRGSWAGRRTVEKASACQANYRAVPTVTGPSVRIGTTHTIRNAAPVQAAFWNASEDVNGSRTPGVGQRILRSGRRRTRVVLKRTVAVGPRVELVLVCLSRRAARSWCWTSSLVWSHSLWTPLTRSCFGPRCTTTPPGADAWRFCTVQALIRPERLFRRVTRHSL